jgi:PAS domain S-box-containing protein
MRLADDSTLAAVVTHAPGLLCLLGPDERCRAASPELARLLGYAMSELVGRSLDQLVYDADLARKAVGPSHAQVRLRRFDGTARWVDWNAVAIAGGGFLCAAHDITADRTLRDAAGRLRTVLSHAPVILFALDEDGRFTSVEGRDAVATLTRGVDDGHLVGRSAFEVCAHLPELVSSVRLALAGREHTATIQIGSQYFEARYEPVIATGGRITGIVGALLDVTIHKETELSLRQSEVRLLEAERLAVLGSLAGGIANQINNALTSTRLSLARLISFELAQRPMTPARMHRLELLQEAREGLARVEHVTQELRAFSRAEDVPPAPIDLHGIVQAVVGIAAHEVQHRAKLVCDLEPVPHVVGKEPELRQVFLNLLLNAAQAMEDAPGERGEVRVATYTDDAGHAIVEISDTGAGIPAADLPRIFEPFFTTRPRGKGLGLGLSVARDIVTQIHGTITAESEVGRGTRVKVVLPPAAQPEVAAAPPPATAVGEAPLRCRILIVDDDRPVAAAVALELEDHDVVVAGSGREALEILRRDPEFDVVLCDLMMPELSGADVYEWLKPVEPELVERFVFMTGGAFTSRAERFLAEVGNPRLDKPFHPEELRSLILRVAGQRSRARTVPTRPTNGTLPAAPPPSAHK